MDSITHLAQKLIVERARQDTQQSQQQPIPETAPPPYTVSEDNDSSDSDSDDEEDEDERVSPMYITINAATSIQGSNNLVPSSSSPLADATKFSALLLHAINRISEASATKPQRRPINVALTINCGVTIVGDRNVVGNIGLKPKSVSPAMVKGEETPAATAGAKRKAVGTPEDGENEPPAQKRRMSSPASGPVS